MIVKSNFHLIKVIIVLCTVLVSNLCQTDSSEDYQVYKSPLDSLTYRPVFHKVREIIFNIIGKTGHRKYGRFLQEAFPDVVDFPCHLVNVVSQEVPTSVHELRPGDINVIMALGDSVTVAYGAAATNVIETTIENRGMSWSIGGQWDWRNSTTLPNILKKFNPNLIGFSTGDGLSFMPQTQFNMGEIGALSMDLPFMAQKLVERLKNDPRVDFKNHWKLLTITIGGNDMCTHICQIEEPENYPEAFRKHMKKALDYLKDNLPRTFVNLVPMAPLYDNILVDDKPERCELMQLFLCSCWLGNLYNQTDERRSLYRSVQHQMTQIQKELAHSYRGLDNFTVVYQPFSEKFSIKNSMGMSDFSLTAFDCFHLSHKGNAWAGTSVWNNMLEPSGNKSKTLSDPRTKFLCPSEEHPYFHTYDNDNYNSPS